MEIDVSVLQVGLDYCMIAVSAGIVTGFVLWGVTSGLHVIWRLFSDVSSPR